MTAQQAQARRRAPRLSARSPPPRRRRRAPRCRGCAPRCRRSRYVRSGCRRLRRGGRCRNSPRWPRASHGVTTSSWMGPLASRHHRPAGAQAHQRGECGDDDGAAADEPLVLGQKTAGKWAMGMRTGTWRRPRSKEISLEQPARVGDDRSHSGAAALCRCCIVMAPSGVPSSVAPSERHHRQSTPRGEPQPSSEHGQPCPPT